MASTSDADKDIFIKRSFRAKDMGIYIYIHVWSGIPIPS